jgi:4-hydroxybenzoate polyprenyltransferase
LILPAFASEALVPQLDLIHFSLFILCTLFIAGAGYVINDILDLRIDQINKPKLSYVENKILFKSAWIYYYSLVIFGSLLALYLAWHVQKIELVLIYPLATLLLFYYSKSLKGRVFIGNLVVAFFCGFVTGILLLSEPILIEKYNYSPIIREVTNIIIAYSILGMMVNLLREICKDLEDMEGDKAALLNTMPLTKGVNFTKNVFQSILIILIVVLLSWGFLLTEGDFRSKSFFCIFIIAPLGILISRMIQAKNKVHYTKISGILKMVMATAIIYVLIFKSSFII